MEFKCRPLKQRDTETVVEIDWRYNATDAWTIEKFANHANKWLFNVVVDDHDTVIGYVAYRIRKRGVQLMRCVVHGIYRRCGTGLMITRFLANAARHARCDFVFAAVPDSLLPEPHYWLLGCGFDQMERSIDPQDGMNTVTYFQFATKRTAAVQYAGRAFR